MSLACLTSGQGADLVLLHGWAMNAGVWQPILAALESRYRVHRIELPGHGESPWDTKQDDLRHWAEAALAVAPAQAVWCGWSLGGQIALCAASLEPQRVLALVMLASTPKFVQNAAWTAAVEERVFADFTRLLLENVQKTRSRFLAIQVMGTENERTLRQCLQVAVESRPIPNEAALHIGLALLAQSDLRALIQGLGLPILWFFGRRDSLIPSTVVEPIRRLRPNDRIEVIEKASHAPFLSHQQAFLTALDDFFASVP